MSGESLNLILAITSIITTITLIVTLGIVASQTAQLTKQTRLNTVITYHQYYKDVNVALLQNEQAAQRVLGESKEDSIASIILVTLELAFQLHEGHLTDQSWWISDEATVAYTMKQEYMRLHWDENKYLYNQRFAQFIDRKLQEIDQEKQNSSMVH
jgi:hypothetical protein